MRVTHNPLPGRAAWVTPPCSFALARTADAARASISGSVDSLRKSTLPELANHYRRNFIASSFRTSQSIRS